MSAAKAGSDGRSRPSHFASAAVTRGKIRATSRSVTLCHSIAPIGPMNVSKMNMNNGNTRPTAIA